MKTFAALATSAAIGLVAAQSDSSCKDGVHVVIARGTNETAPEGALAHLAPSVLNRIPNSDSVGVNYPATANVPVYFESVPDGVGNMTQEVIAYSDKCPSTKLVLMGYSQGAQVIGDVLIGSNSSGFPTNTPLTSKYLDRVLAVILMGDPSFVLNVSINVGNATHGGIFPRGNQDQWAARGLVGRVKSYCDFNDTFCDGGRSDKVHSGYIPEYGNQAVDFIASLYSKATSNSTSAGSSSSTASTGSAAGSTDAASSTSASSAASSPTGSSSAGASQSPSPTPGSSGAAGGLRSSTAGFFALASFFAAAFAFVL